MQNYLGSCSIILVDDKSSDGTDKIGEKIVQEIQSHHDFNLIHSQSLPRGWTGKLWAIHQGIQKDCEQSHPPDYFLLTDADIKHHPNNLKKLFLKAEYESLD